MVKRYYDGGYKMRRLLCILMIFLMIGVASAAVYITFNPEAKIFFDRPQPGPDVLPVQSLIQMENGAWTNSYGMGTMSGDILEIEMAHKNGDASTFIGAVYFEIECAQGLVDDLDGSGIRDFELLVYGGPDGSIYPCNNDGSITRLSDTKIRVVPIAAEYEFEYGVFEHTNLSIEFLPMAYGDYTVAVYVDKKINIG